MCEQSFPQLLAFHFSNGYSKSVDNSLSISSFIYYFDIIEFEDLYSLEQNQRRKKNKTELDIFYYSM